MNSRKGKSRKNMKPVCKRKGKVRKFAPALAGVWTSAHQMQPPAALMGWISSIRQATSMAQFHQMPSFRSCTLMQLYIRNNGQHVSSNKQGSVDQLHFSNDAAIFFEVFQRETITDDALRLLSSTQEGVQEKRGEQGSQGMGQEGKGTEGLPRRASDYLCKKLGMMSCPVLLAFLHFSLKLDVLLLQRMLVVSQT